MAYTIKKKLKVEPPTGGCDRPPLTQALNHIERKMHTVRKPAGETVVSHIPVSIGSQSRSPTSTLCSLSSKESSDHEDTMSVSMNSSTTTIRPLSESYKPKELDANPTRIDSQDSTHSGAMIRTVSKASLLPSTITTTAADNNNITRPAKKARTVSVQSGTLSSSTTAPRAVSPQPQHSSALLLLGQDEDEDHLNPLHVFIRKQIEVFTATPTELSQPAPGRKQPIKLHQVGLRCIHCRHALPNGAKKARVKRAVCYPTSIGRIYHSVSDMKFDHFSHCPHLPAEVRETFENLKAGAKRTEKGKHPKISSSNNKGQSSSSTAKYYRDSALRMGLRDSPAGIMYDSATQLLQASPSKTNLLQQHQLEEYRNQVLQQQSLHAANYIAAASILFPQMQAHNNNKGSTVLKNPTITMNPGMLQSLLVNAIAAGANAQKSLDAAIALSKEQQNCSSHNFQRKRPREVTRTTDSAPANPIPSTETSGESSAPFEKIILPLDTPEDTDALNPLHCFVRKHVEFFSADQEDITAPCPGRKTRVTLGQVGIRCKHCAKLQLSPKQRVKRAVCYPPSIDGIYHSVSNMKFDHFDKCPGLSVAEREELAVLKASCKARGKLSTKTSGGGGASTAQYYRTSAVAKGLVDTDKGIRFCRPCTPANTTAPRENSQHSEEKRSTCSATKSTTPVVSKNLPILPSGISALVMAAASHSTCV